MNAAVMADTARWAEYFASDWQQETPTRIHSAELAPDGTPRWHPSFEQWLTGDRLHQRRNDQQRLRTTRVMRKLRRAAVREYECLFRILVLNERIPDTTTWLNDRAERNAIPYPPHRPDGPHYVEKDTYALVVAGIAFCKEMW
jgi:hypothetical protein